MANTIRMASYEDAPALIELMEQLATFENMKAVFNPSLKQMETFLANAEDHPIGHHPTNDGRLLHAWIAENDDGYAVGFAMGFYGGFSSFASSWEFCLHDLFVHPEVRRTGLAKQFFQHIAKEVCEYTQSISFEVLDWNSNAIKLYEGLGSRYYTDRIEQNGTVWKQLKIEGKAFYTLIKKTFLIRIIAVPPSSTASDAIREQWVGVVMPAELDTDDVDWGDDQNSGGYVVSGINAVDALLAAGRLPAAQFWGSPVPPPLFRFGSAFCEVVEEY